MSQRAEQLETAARPDRGEARPCASPTKGSQLAREYLITLAAASALYLISVAPGPLWQDSGMAQNRVLRYDLFGDLGLALSHPLYYVLAIVFQWLPLTESALKTNLVSALFGAITVANIFLYSVVLIALTLVFALVSPVGWIYLSSAAALGTIFILFAWQLKQSDSRPRARRLYLYSLLYLALLFVAIIVDSTVAL